MEIPWFLKRTKPEVKEPILKAPTYKTAEYHASNDTYEIDGKIVSAEEFVRLTKGRSVVDTDTNRIVSERMADHMRIRNKGRNILGVPIPPTPIKETENKDDDPLETIVTGFLIAEALADTSDLGSSSSEE